MYEWSALNTHVLCMKTLTTSHMCTVHAHSHNIRSERPDELTEDCISLYSVGTNPWSTSDTHIRYTHQIHTCYARISHIISSGIRVYEPCHVTHVVRIITFRHIQTPSAHIFLHILNTSGCMSAEPACMCPPIVDISDVCAHLMVHQMFRDW